jgi:hypothetical protein
MATQTERYEAVVVANDDPEKRGRIRVACAGLVGDEDAALPFWVEPLFDWGLFVVPDVKESVEIEVDVASDTDESYQQTSLEALNPRWRTKRHYTDAFPVHEDFTSKNYGKRRGFVTPRGHTMVFDDAEGSEAITLTWRSKDGKAQTLSIVDDKAEIKLDGATLTITGKDASTVTVLGDGAVKAAIADHLQVLWTTFKALYDAHLHPEVALRAGLATAGADPTLLSLAPLAAAGLATAAAAPPTPPAAPMNAWDANINSTKLRFPNG